MKDRTEGWLFVGAILVTICFLAMFWITPPQKPEPKPVYFQPAGRPDSIPCSSALNEKCMIYTPPNTFPQESETENNVH